MGTRDGSFDHAPERSLCKGLIGVIMTIRCATFDGDKQLPFGHAPRVKAETSDFGVWSKAVKLPPGQFSKLGESQD
jgi:hypothetical protein